jgi:hypothetical protein
MATMRRPLVERVPKGQKRTGDRTRKPGIPASIRVHGVTIDDDDRDYIRRRLGEKLGRYVKAVERVSVRLSDINGPRGGDDIQCRVKVVLSGQPSVVVEHQASTYRPALTAGLSGGDRAVRRTLQGGRTRPIRATR